MAKGRDYEERAEKLLQPLIDKNNFELVDVEYVKEAGNWFLRAYIDKEGGITIDDCELISRAFSDLLDREDFIEESYILEVSSPGLGRQLKKDKDFQRSLGREIEVKLYKPVKIANEGKEITAKELIGELKAFDGEAIELLLKSGESIRLLRTQVAIARLALDF